MKLTKLLSDPSEVVRVEAVEAIGNIKEASGRHYNDLNSRLTDHRIMVRIVTVEALAQINDRRAIPNIKARLFDASPLVRAFAAIGLAELKCKKCRTAIARCLSEEYEDAASSGYLVALVLLGDRTKITPLLNLLLSRNYRVRCFVANWLPRLRIGRRLVKSVEANLREATKRPLERADLSTMKETLTQLRRVAKP
jgi:HEAT repeats